MGEILINDTPYKMPMADSIDYETIVNAAGYDLNGNAPVEVKWQSFFGLEDGELTKGEYVRLTEGMIFFVNEARA